jgi:hypothetical protein
MTGTAYRVPCKPVAPGSEVPEEQMCIIESMPVKSLITYPKSGIEHALGKKFALRGHAWAGDLSVNAVHVSIDFGASWHQAKLEKPVNRLAWQHWKKAARSRWYCRVGTRRAISTMPAIASRCRSPDAVRFRARRYRRRRPATGNWCAIIA